MQYAETVVLAKKIPERRFEFFPRTIIRKKETFGSTDFCYLRILFVKSQYAINSVALIRTDINN